MSLTDNGGDLRDWGTVPPKFEVGDVSCIRAPNILSNYTFIGYEAT